MFPYFSKDVDKECAKSKDLRAQVAALARVRLSIPPPPTSVSVSTATDEDYDDAVIVDSMIEQNKEEEEEKKQKDAISSRFFKSFYPTSSSLSTQLAFIISFTIFVAWGCLMMLENRNIVNMAVQRWLFRLDCEFVEGELRMRGGREC